MKQVTKEQAIALHDVKFYEGLTAREKVEFQLFQDRLCMPFGVFREAIEVVLKRPVYTHEFAYRDEMIKEFLGEKEPPTFEQIIGLIPADKLITIQLQSHDTPPAQTRPISDVLLYVEQA